MKKIMVVDDELDILSTVGQILELNGYDVIKATDGMDCLDKLTQSLTSPDLILLDIMMPVMDGYELCRLLKQHEKFHHIPVIFVTARRRELDEVVGLELGADDYITKPFDVDVLLAHIKAVLRRSERQTQLAEKPHPLQVGELAIDPLAHVVSVAGRQVDLSPREFDLLHTLALQPNRVFSVAELLANVWGAEFEGQPQVVYVHMRWLREKIEPDPNQPRTLLTVRGVGYKLVSP